MDKNFIEFSVPTDKLYKRRTKKNIGQINIGQAYSAY